jgi:hypothetical protein
MRNPAFLALLSLSLISVDCTAQAPSNQTPLTQGEFVGRAVQLVDEQGSCVLRREGDAPIKLDMPWPCRFSEDRQKRIRVETFHQTPILMIERSVADALSGNNCDTHLQAVRFLNSRLEAAPVSRIAMCGPGQWDQKAFHAVFAW